MARCPGARTGKFIIVGLLPRIASEFAVGIPAASQLVFAYAVRVAFGSPILTLLLARENQRYAAILSLSIFRAGTIACAVAPVFSLLLLARVATALAHGTFFGVGTTIATEFVAPDKRGQAVSLLFLGPTIANVLRVPAAVTDGPGQKNGGYHRRGDIPLDLRVAAFTLNTLLQLLMVEKVKTAPRLGATLNQGTFNFGKARERGRERVVELGCSYGDLPFLSAGLALTSLFFVCFIGMRIKQIPVTHFGNASTDWEITRD